MCVCCGDRSDRLSLNSSCALELVARENSQPSTFPFKLESRWQLAGTQDSSAGLQRVLKRQPFSVSLHTLWRLAVFLLWPFPTSCPTSPAEACNSFGQHKWWPLVVFCIHSTGRTPQKDLGQAVETQLVWEHLKVLPEEREEVVVERCLTSLLKLDLTKLLGRLRDFKIFNIHLLMCTFQQSLTLIRAVRLKDWLVHAIPYVH